MIVTLILLAVGLGAMLAFEWNNPATMGPLDVPGKLLAGFFQGVQPRTAGFNTLDYGAMHDETQLIMTGLMYIGAGSAGTGGGIKVTTLALLALMIWAEIRGEPEVNAFGRRIPASTQRQALTIALIALVGGRGVHARPDRGQPVHADAERLRGGVGVRYSRPLDRHHR